MQDARSPSVVLRVEAGAAGQRQIALSASVRQSTVHEYVERFRAAGLSWPLLAEMSELELERRLFPIIPSTAKPGSRIGSINVERPTPLDVQHKSKGNSRRPKNQTA